MPERIASPRGAARPVKHSFTIAGHRTSISLERAFWAALRDAAAAERMTLAALVRHIDQGRGEAGLSSAVRVWILDYVQARRVASTPTPGAATEAGSNEQRRLRE